MKETRLSSDSEVPIGTRLYVVETGEWRTHRPIVTAHLCKKCGSCYLYCPTQCIVQKTTHFEADLTYCKGCGICSHECPAFAITMGEEKEELVDD
jgi:2-oxoacid:acceptor oxidoreductase delta subunit (pyruvate/2-ketoisovalerate family)